MNGTKLNFKDLRLVYCDLLRQSGKYYIRGDDDASDDRFVVDVNEYSIKSFKKQFNFASQESGTKTQYDINKVMTQHAANFCTVCTVRHLLPNIIKYVGQHDQVMLWSGGDNRKLYATKQSAPFIGKIKATSMQQNIYRNTNNV